jgi:hypothetical protein
MKTGCSTILLTPTKWFNRTQSARFVDGNQTIWPGVGRLIFVFSVFFAVKYPKT